MAKKQRGAPQKPEADKKATPVQFRMTDAEKAAFKAASELAGVSLSAWMRERLRTAARDELGSAGKRIAFMS